MKPQLLKVSNDLVHSFSSRQDKVPYVNNHWHYHPEVELIYFREGNGTRFIGDSIQHFQSGDVYLVGTNLPHYWRFDNVYFEDEENNHADVSVIHFNENFWGDSFLQLPENTVIRNILEKSKHGIKINGDDRHSLGRLIEATVKAEGPQKIMLLMEALMRVGSAKQVEVISSIGSRVDFATSENDRINAIYNYSIANFKRKIQIEEMAEVANISPNSFCRYFKSRTSKTYLQFINEIRVGHACKLLIENKMNLKQICYESGFHNFTSFHKYFKSITGKSPLVYQKTVFK
ncbi:helix-turn-helix domain-containing protein [Mucilaginibacter sp. dw_454]|uniref:AraC family transcriptional regulator n=1 Tax=Mucilaginibacter sp. dw_454 TaxID=2720079 RepID=UPI001BD46CD5|nr:helix-turn-helix domain-containing protein [Mucilaginibacter sp. dw_454]